MNSCLKIYFRIILFGKCFIVIFLFWGVVVGISTTKLTETRRWSVVAGSSMQGDRNAEKVVEYLATATTTPVAKSIQPAI